MSSLSGNRTNTGEHGHGNTYGYEAAGMPTRTKCLGCGKPKHSSESHPECSEIIQLDMQVQRIMDRINGYGVTV